MEQELGSALRRTVDLVTRRAVEESHNHIRRYEILRTAEPFFLYCVARNRETDEALANLTRATEELDVPYYD